MNLETKYDSTTYNRAYLASLRFAKISLRETPDTLKTLYAKNAQEEDARPSMASQ